MVWASLGVFGAITTAVNEAWGVEKQRSFWKHRMVSFLMLVASGGVVVVVRVTVLRRRDVVVGQEPGRPGMILGKALEIVDRPLHACRVRDGRDMQEQIRRPAHGRVHQHGLALLQLPAPREREVLALVVTGLSVAHRGD